MKGLGKTMKESHKKVLWFVGLWVASVATLAAISYLIKLVIMP